MNTNGKAYGELSEQEKAEFRKLYSDHPLVDYIDWKEYYNSPDGDALDFVKCIGKYKDDKEQDVFVLSKLVDNDLDYLLIFVCGENAFYKVPDTEVNI